MFVNWHTNLGLECLLIWFVIVILFLLHAQENGYQLLFLSARAISQAHITRRFLFSLKQVLLNSVLVNPIYLESVCGGHEFSICWLCNKITGLNMLQFTDTNTAKLINRVSCSSILLPHMNLDFQDGKALPDGPVVISPDGLFPSLYREGEHILVYSHYCLFI